MQNLDSTKSPTQGRQKNIDLRSREYLLDREIDSIITAAKKSKNGLRDSTLILLMYRHGLRMSEATNLKWSDVDLVTGTIHINRKKNGVSGRHPLTRIELVALGKMYRTKSPYSQYVFLSRHKLPLSDSTVQNIFKKLGVLAGIEFPVHPHMLRHSCGYKLANDGVDTRTIAEFLGHTSMNNTYRYTAISPNRFNQLWKD
jgi:type 1 fimbriae regulatory protein FimE